MNACSAEWGLLNLLNFYFTILNFCRGEYGLLPYLEVKTVSCTVKKQYLSNFIAKGEESLVENSLTP